MSRRTLITGGAGFLGLHLARALLQAGDDVTLVDDFSRGADDPDLAAALDAGARVHRADLADPTSLDSLGTGFHCVVHLAAIVGVRNVVARPGAVLDLNHRLLTTALGFAARQADLARFLFTSTSEVYAGGLGVIDLPVPTPEDVPLVLAPVDQPRTSYALSKIVGEGLCLHSGLPVTVVRPHNVYGPRMGRDHVVPELLDRAYSRPREEALEVFSVDHRRAFCFVDDAVEMLARCLEAPGAVGQVLNLGNAAAEVTIGYLAEQVLEVVGVQRTIEARPATPGSPARRCPDVTRMAEVTGFRAQVDLTEGLRRTFAWYRQRVFDPEASRA